MNSKFILRTAIILSIVIVNVGCDKVSKKIVRENVSQNEVIRVLSNHLMVTNVENSGAFLSLGNSLPQGLKNILLSLLPAIVILMALYYTIRKQSIAPLLLTGLCFIVGGGIGNIYDRIAYGSVTDFLQINAGGFRTGIFNMADVSIMTGALVILLSSILKRKMPA